MRIDKFLKLSRIFKRRTVAAEACDSGKVQLNGRQAKPAAQVKPADIIKVTLSGNAFIVKVVSTEEKNVKKGDAEKLYEVIQG